MIARKLRRAAADVEQRLWRALQTGALPWKFRRQHPIGCHIVDFPCPARKLAIELDGGQHAMAQAADARRSAEIAKFGYRVVRFWNDEVSDNLDGVLQSLRQALENPPPHPDPLRPQGRRGS